MRITRLAAICSAAVLTLISCTDPSPTETSRTAPWTTSEAVAGSVPACGLEGKAACAPAETGSRCDRGLRLSLSGTPLNLTDDVCLNDQRHLVGASFRDSWLDWALTNQRDLAIDEPINWVLHISTHNANNNIADGETVDPNQAWSISDQLDLGSRFIWLDLHWVSGQARLCHAHVIEKGPEFHVGCGAADRQFGYALHEINAWLEDNPDEIVVIDLEAYMEGNNSHLIDPIVEILGSKVFRQSERTDDRVDAGRWPSRRELRAMGKNVIVASLGSTFGDYVHPRHLPNNFEIRLIKNLSNVERTSGIVTDCGTDFSGWETLVANNDVWRVVGEDRTTLGIANNWAGVLTAQNVRDIANCNIPSISFDMMSASRPTSNEHVAGRIAQLDLITNRIPSEELHRYVVWSWTEDDRGRFGDAALLNGNTGRWSSTSTSETHRFACAPVRSETRPRGTGANEWGDREGTSWRVTTRAGSWKEGGRACFDEFGSDGYVFSVPVNGLMNGRLRLADASRGDVWLNYNDISDEGRWLINRRPVGNAGADQRVECTDHHGTLVRLDGRASSDAEDHTLTYEWRGAFGVATGAQPQVLLPAGKHIVQLIVDDGFGGVSADNVEINVIDTKPPVILAARVDPSVLWPPNHAMRPVTITIDARDICDAQIACSIASITSEEAGNAKGDGNTTPDWRITGALTAELRAERSGIGGGRRYSLTVRCVDDSGNFATRVLMVDVTHDQRQGGSP